MIDSFSKSDSISKLAVALVAFHKECPKVFKTELNPHLNSKYADLAKILETVTPFLCKHGLAVTQMPAAMDGDTYYLRTMLLHESGEYIENVGAIRPLDTITRKADKSIEQKEVRSITPQTTGAAITYLRRYSIAAILSLNIDDDDDGEGSRQNKTSSKNKPEPNQQENKEPKPKKTEAEIKDMMIKIGSMDNANAGKFEQAIHSHWTSGVIDKPVYMDLLNGFFVRWYAVADAETIAKIPLKVGKCHADKFISDDNKVFLDAEMKMALQRFKEQAQQSKGQ